MLYLDSNCRYCPKPWKAERSRKTVKNKIPTTIHVTKIVENILWSNRKCMKKATTRPNFRIENINIAGTNIYSSSGTVNHHTSIIVMIPNIVAIIQ